jgi:capsular polysaccharide biosynthesis protein
MTSIRSFFGTARAWFGLVVLGTLLGGAISLGVGLMSPPTYLGKVTVLVSPPTGTNPITLSDVEVTQALAPTFAELTTTAPLLQRVITATRVDTDVDTLAKLVSTHVPVGTSLIEVGVSDHDPATAAALANEIASQLMAFRSDTSSPVTSKVVLSVVDPAVAPRTPEGLSPVLRAVLGALIGLFLSISLGFLIENVGRGAQRLGQGLDASARPSTTRSQTQPTTDPSALPASLARTATMRIDSPARPVATPLQAAPPRLQPAAIRTSTYPPSGWAAPSDARPATTSDPRVAT